MVMVASPADDFLESLPRLPLAAEMARWDRLTVEFGIPENLLMENAGRVACDVAREKYGPLRDSAVWLFMGGGNNGGDAAAMARHIQDAGGQAIIFCARDAAGLSASPAWHLRLARDNGAIFHRLEAGDIPVSALLEMEPRPPALIVDALLGTGFHGVLSAPMLGLIRAVNAVASRLGRPILAIDTPSGLNADLGTPCPEAIRADVTVTLAAAKPGLLLPAARIFTGTVVCRAIGIPRAVATRCPSLWRLLEGRCLARKTTEVEAAYKNIFGHVLVIGGARGYAGAASLASAAALRSGAGLVSVCAPAANLMAVKADWPEIMTLAAGPGQDWPSEPDEALLKAIAGADAIVLGPGMGRTEAALSFVQAVLSLPQRPPAVVDADALAVLGLQQTALHGLLNEGDIITPHPGEAAMLLRCAPGEVQARRQDALDALCGRTEAVAVLKGAGTLIGQGRDMRLMCPYDIPQLAIGGAGDVLAGCAGANLASRRPRAAATIGKAGLAVITHAIAALSLAREYPNRGFTASQLADALAHAAEFAGSEAEPTEGVLPWPR